MKDTQQQLAACQAREAKLQQEVAQQEQALADAARQAAQLSSQLEEAQGKVRAWGPGGLCNGVAALEPGFACQQQTGGA